MPLLIPIPPAAKFRPASSIIPRLLRPGIYELGKGICYSREDIFKGANQDTNLMRKYVGSAQVTEMGIPISMPNPSPWMRPYPIEQWPQEHHARQGPQVPTPCYTRFTSEHFPLRPLAPYIARPTETTFLIHAPRPPQYHRANYQDPLSDPVTPSQIVASPQDTTPADTPSPVESPMLDLQTLSQRESESFTSTLLDTDFSYVWSEYIL